MREFLHRRGLLAAPPHPERGPKGGGSHLRRRPLLPRARPREVSAGSRGRGEAGSRGVARGSGEQRQQPRPHHLDGVHPAGARRRPCLPGTFPPPPPHLFFCSFVVANASARCPGPFPLAPGPAVPQCQDLQCPCASLTPQCLAGLSSPRPSTSSKPKCLPEYAPPSPSLAVAATAHGTCVALR